MNNGSASTEERTSPSLSLVYEEAKERLALQLQQVDVLDSKVNVVFGFAGLFLAAASVLQGVFRTASNRWPMVIGFAALAVVYIIAMYLAYQAYKTRPYRRDPAPGPLRDVYLHESEEVTKRKLLNNLIESFSENEKLIAEKLRYVRWALKLLMIGSMGLSLGVFLVLVFC